MAEQATGGAAAPSQDGALWNEAKQKTQAPRCVKNPGEKRLNSTCGTKIYERLLFFYNPREPEPNMKLVVFLLHRSHEIRKRIKSIREGG